VIYHRQPIPEDFELLPKADLLRRTELIKTAGFDGVEEFDEVVVQLVEGHT
jgi:hypothetical protein